MACRECHARAPVTVIQAAKRAAAAAARQPATASPPAPRGVWADRQPESPLAKQLAAVRKELAELKGVKSAADNMETGAPDQADGDVAAVEKLKKDIQALESIDGAEEILLKKQEQLAALVHERKASRPFHQQLRDVQARIDRKEKACKRRREDELPKLQQAAREAQAAADRAAADLEKLEAEVTSAKLERDQIIAAQAQVPAGTHHGDPAQHSPDALLSNISAMLPGGVAVPAGNAEKLQLVGNMLRELLSSCGSAASGAAAATHAVEQLDAGAAGTTWPDLSDAAPPGSVSPLPRPAHGGPPRSRCLFSPFACGRRGRGPEPCY